MPSIDPYKDADHERAPAHATTLLHQNSPQGKNKDDPSPAIEPGCPSAPSPGPLHPAPAPSPPSPAPSCVQQKPPLRLRYQAVCPASYAWPKRSGDIYSITSACAQYDKGG